MRARNRRRYGLELLPLPDGELTFNAIRAWVEAHRDRDFDAHYTAYFIASMSMMWAPPTARAPGQPDRELAEAYRARYAPQR